MSTAEGRVFRFPETQHKTSKNVVVVEVEEGVGMELAKV